MKMKDNHSNSFTVEDIRKLRDDFDKRFTDENGNIDWAGATAETEKGAARVLAELDRIRSERANSLNIHQ
jgi:hypothetical protein